MSFTTILFGHGPDIGPWQECARAAVMFVYGLVAVRIVGRRVFGKWAALDIVVSVIIGSNLSRALTGPAPMGGTLAATTVLLALHWILAQLAARSPRLSHLIEGRMAALVRDGQVQRGPALRWSVSAADVDEALRQKGLRSVDEVQLATLEPSGKIAVFPKTGGKSAGG